MEAGRGLNWREKGTLQHLPVNSYPLFIIIHELNQIKSICWICFEAFISILAGIPVELGHSPALLASENVRTWALTQEASDASSRACDRGRASCAR